MEGKKEMNKQLSKQSMIKPLKNFFVWPLKKKIGDFTERWKEEGHFRSWKTSVLVWRFKSDLLWESIQYGIQSKLGRRVEMSFLHDDRAIYGAQMKRKKKAYRIWTL